ncbi:MAG: hypothetical protein K1X51_11205 [Rhodospirillaceae bacterium]|nr:hypothetical protein [Rhodospirillaceae bacterium]
MASVTAQLLTLRPFSGVDLGITGHWTGTSDGPTRQWYINFADGSERTYGGSVFRNAVRLVRQGK